MHSLFSRMRHFVQRKNYIKVAGEKFGCSVIYAYKIAALLCFSYLCVK